mmetsp:Transcript_38736/g.111851  ORF Transcript_38736/g.111851 Transcript_38736/m.111851 type:complete len:198 (+) Transcript_38736:73-666(+)
MCCRSRKARRHTSYYESDSHGDPLELPYWEEAKPDWYALAANRQLAAAELDDGDALRGRWRNHQAAAAQSAFASEVTRQQGSLNNDDRPVAEGAVDSPRAFLRHATTGCSLSLALEQITLSDWVREVYARYNPAKASRVGELLEKYQGREEELIEHIVAKYRLGPCAPRHHQGCAQSLDEAVAHMCGACSAEPLPRL